MSSSFTEFRAKGFWSHDVILEVWLRVLTLHLGSDASSEGWQRELHDHWLSESSGNSCGFISPALDEFLTDEDRLAVVLRSSEEGINRLNQFGDFVPFAFLNSLGIETAFPPYFSSDHPIEWYNLVASRFMALLKGELTADAANSPTVPATRLGERWDEGKQPRVSRHE